jgi:hypothetical protein
MTAIFMCKLITKWTNIDIQKNEKTNADNEFDGKKLAINVPLNYYVCSKKTRKGF